MPEKEIIYIDGYWADTKEKFSSHKCVIGEWDGDENDHDIFYHFDSEEDIKFMMKEENCGSEFVVTKYYK